MRFTLRTAADGSFSGRSTTGIPASDGGNDLYMTLVGRADFVVHAQLRVEHEACGPHRARSFTLAPDGERELGRWRLGPACALVFEGTTEPPRAGLTFEVHLRFEHTS